MKGSHSRLSFQAANRYSNVAHVQGAMLTDADLTEAAQIHLARDDAQGAAFAGSGVPAIGGMVEIDVEDQLILQDGTVFAQGKQGHFRIGGQTGNVEKALALQADLPDGPEATSGLVYVDVWERPVFPHEDPYLADAALHGAQTSYRTRTMVQLKTLPGVEDMAQLSKFLQKHPAFLPKGTATLSAKLLGGSVSIDACDPCADIINIDKVLPNALFRLEVVSVQRDKNGAMEAVRLAWSMENAETVEPMATRKALERDNAVYEYFSEVTEAQAGYFHDGYTPARGGFSTTLTAETPDDDTLPKDEKRGYTHVRRWDGMARVALDTDTPASGPSGKSSGAKASKTQMSLTTEFFSLSLTHANREIVAGDYWLIELRRYAPEGEQVLLNGAALGENAQEPLGPVHHFCPIGIWNGEGFSELPDALRRRLSFPTLSDLPASHIGYDADPDCDLLGDSETVQQALDRVCEIDARHVGFTPSDEECETLAGSRSVDDALNALCRADNNKQLQLMLRTMMDWGVVCGMAVELGPKGIEVGGGVALDRSGVLHELDRTSVDLSKLEEAQLLPDAKQFANLKGRNVEICLSLGVNGDNRAYFLSPASLVYGQGDLTLSEQVRACLDGKGSLSDSELFEKLKEKSDHVAVLTKLHVCLRNDIKPLPGMELVRGEIEIASQLLEMLIEEYVKRLDGSGDPLAKDKGDELRAINKALDLELKNSGFDGSGGQLALVAWTLKYAAIMKKDEEFRLSCLCSNVVPDCPAIEEGWSLIPLACVDLSSYEAGRITATEVCMMCCRKQANTPRSHRFYNGDMVGDILAGFKELCTEEQLKRDNGPSARLRQWLRDAGPAPWDAPNKTPLWPAKPTYGGAVQTFGPAPSGGGGLAVLNEWQRGLNPAILDITGKKVDEAMEMLKGAGFDLLEKLDAGNVDALVKIAGNQPLLNRRPQRGDGVVLLVQDEIAVEFVVTKQAQNRFFFGTLIPGILRKADPQVFVLNTGALDLTKTLEGKGALLGGGGKQPAKEPEKELAKTPRRGGKALDLGAKQPELAVTKKVLDAKALNLALNAVPGGIAQGAKAKAAVTKTPAKEVEKTPAKGKGTVRQPAKAPAKAPAKTPAKNPGRVARSGTAAARKRNLTARGPTTPRKPPAKK